MKVVYPAIFLEDRKQVVVYVPDLDAWTFGDSLADAIMMARDRISLAVALCEEEGSPVPAASSYEAAVQKAKQADTAYDLSKGTLTMVDADSIWNHRKNSTKMVKKNCTLPKYLKEEAERAGLNFSQVLQEALVAKLARR